ncbi:hypothetical protein LCGC14_2269040 [marine sediment metagenome]|uniref:Uncharacterized protein n=1 Tax=marine sediment metagenome TaxID=412755 RepID=A0A0F9CXH2_9ZZZZ
MSSRYSKRHYEDVARLLRCHHLEGNDCDIYSVAHAFADLFAADNTREGGGQYE